MTGKVAALIDRLDALEREVAAVRGGLRSLVEADFDEMVDADTLAPRLKVSTKTLYDLAGQGAIPSHKIGSAVRFVPREVYAESKRGAQCGTEECG